MSSQQLDCFLVIVGDELLQGHTRDRNTPIIADRLRRRGAVLRQASIVPDSSDAIAGALCTALEEKAGPRLLITCGGTGYTPDDVTLEGVSRAVGRKLVFDPLVAAEAERTLRMARRRGVDLPADAQSQMLQHAQVPEGTTVHLCDGWIGALEISFGDENSGDGATILVLPGIPDYLPAIFDQIVEPLFLAANKTGMACREVCHSLPEVALLPALSRLAHEYSDVAVGSYPGAPSVLRVQGPRLQVDGALRLLEGELELLQACSV